MKMRIELITKEKNISGAKAWINPPTRSFHVIRNPRKVELIRPWIEIRCELFTANSPQLKP